MGKEFFLFLAGVALISLGSLMLSRMPDRPAMKYEPAGLDDQGRTEYRLVPCDEIERQKALDRDILKTGGIVLKFLGVCLILGWIAYYACKIGFEVEHRSSKVFVNDEGKHFHEEDCPCLVRFLWVSSSMPPPQGLKPCSLCNPLSSEGEDGVFAVIGGEHFHREGCELLPKIRSITRARALVVGFKPCPECGQKWSPLG